MKNFLNIVNGNNSNNIPPRSMDYCSEEETINIDSTQQDKNDGKEIKIENKPFRLSSLLHNLTNKLRHIIRDNQHSLYYDVEHTVGRYVIGDLIRIEEVLERLIKDAFSLDKASKVILKISYNSKFLVFDIMNEKGSIDKNILRQYTDVKHVKNTQSDKINTFAHAKVISESMNGVITLKSSRIFGTHYIFKIPYREDENGKNHKEELRKILANKQALFICKDIFDTHNMQYIFGIYGIHSNNMRVTDFESKKPNLYKYDMVIIQSADLSYKHISFFKSISQDEKNNYKLIIVHELFEDKEKIKLTQSIADAELYKPIISGDIEEILYQAFITKSKAVKGINNIEIFDSKSFTIKANHSFTDDYLIGYSGAHIAIVTDNNVDANTLENILMQDEIKLFRRNNGSEMIDLLKDEEIDIIFTDINLPIMDGILMAKKIRSVQKWKKIPIISIASMTLADELKKMEYAGINAAISKPIEAKNIYMALDKFLIMSEKIRMRLDKKNKIKLIFNKNVLDIEKGLRTSKSDIEYLKNLLKIMNHFKKTINLFENMILNEEFIALSKYARDMLALSEHIYAPAMIKMFKDLNYFMLQPKKIYLADYILIYKENLQALENEVENYMNSRNN